MNTVWSDYIQSTKELYESRALRFRIDNAGVWLPMLHIEEGMELLEIGCAGGLLLHRIKQLLPGIRATGLDRDEGHIAFAKSKTAELNLCCDFYVGDAVSLPFGDHIFDITLSHTVIEHVETMPFLMEQYRVLKPGGRIVVLSVRSRFNLNAESWKPADGEEKELFDQLWSNVDMKMDREIHVGEYELGEAGFPRAIENAGFKDVDAQIFTLVCYAPDNASTSDETAERQINEGRLSANESIRKAILRNPDGLDAARQERLYRLINQRYDTRLAQYHRGENLWDMATSTVLCVTGIKS